MLNETTAPPVTTRPPDDVGGSTTSPNPSVVISGHDDVLAALVTAETDFAQEVQQLRAAKAQMEASVSKASDDTLAYNALLTDCKAKLAAIRTKETDAGLAT